MKEYLEKYDDLLSIGERIKLIDTNYELVLNKKTGHVEVHDFSQPGDSFLMRANPLDYRLVEKLWRTRRENMAKFFAELDRENELAEERNLKRVTNKAGVVCEEIAKYSFYNNRDIKDDEIQKIINL